MPARRRPSGAQAWRPGGTARAADRGRAAGRRGADPPRSASAARSRAIERARIEERTLETWIDEGSVRAEAVAAAPPRHGRRPRQRRAAPTRLDPDRRAEITEAAGEPRRAELLQSGSRRPRRRSTASGSTRPAGSSAPLIRAVPRRGRCRARAGRAGELPRRALASQAISELEAARAISPSVRPCCPVLADCYRALRRWDDGRGDLAGDARGVAVARGARRGAASSSPVRSPIAVT